MSYDDLKRLVDFGYSTHAIARKMHTSQTNVRHWLDKYGLKTDRARLKNRYRCKCGETDPANYYKNKKNICSKCDNAYTVKRQQAMASRIRAHLGSKCAYCGYDRFQIALAAHHTEPNKKDPTFHCLRGWKWERVLREIEKCVLACHNCRAAVHAGLLPFSPC